VKVLFAIASPEYLRFYDDTIRVLADRGHQVAVAINRQRDKKPVRLQEFAGVRSLITVPGIVPRRLGLFAPLARGLRGVTDFARYLHPRFASAVALRARMKRKVLPRVFRWMDRLGTLSSRGSRVLMYLLSLFERAIPSSKEIEQFIMEQTPDVVLVSPLVEAGSDQVDLVKGAQALGIPVAACIASWDNLTNKGVLRVRPDQVIVWNEAQRNEAVAFHDVRRENVIITGAQPFDRWFERRPNTTREQFFTTIGLSGDKPFVLFVCSSSFISISDAEVDFVRTWIKTVRSHPLLAGFPVLVRPHPYNCAAWESADFSMFQDVAIWPKQAFNPIEEAQRNHFFDSLYHSVAVVGINTSAMIEAAILGRPVLSLSVEEFSGTQEGTLHFHHLLPENGGFLRLASSLSDHVEQLVDVIERPDTVRQETENFVRSFIRPHGLETPCTPILAGAIEALMNRGRGFSRRMPWWGPLCWPLLFGAGALAGIWLLFTDPKVIRKIRKRLSKGWHRTKKVIRRLWLLTLDRSQRQINRVGTLVRRAVRPLYFLRFLVVRPFRYTRRVFRQTRYATAIRWRERNLSIPPKNK